MAESTLSLAFTDVQYEVGRFLGWNSNASLWTAAQNTAFTPIVKRGLRSFYFPPTQDPAQPYYEWSFMKTLGSTTLTTNNSTYVLADNCSGTVLDHTVTYAVAGVQRRMQKIPEADLRALQAMDNQTGYPKYYSVRNKAHAPTTGQRFEMLVYPTPTAVQNGTVISYQYITLPDSIDSTNKYPLGGALYSEIILQAILGAAENSLDDDPMGPQQQKFQQLLTVAVRDDTNKKSNNRGGNT